MKGVRHKENTLFDAIYVNGEGQGGLAVLQSMGLQKVRYDLATEQQ